MNVHHWQKIDIVIITVLRRQVCMLHDTVHRENEMNQGMGYANYSISQDSTAGKFLFPCLSDLEITVSVVQFENEATHRNNDYATLIYSSNPSWSPAVCEVPWDNLVYSDPAKPPARERDMLRTLKSVGR